MLTALLRFSLGHRALVLVSALGMAVAGAWAFRLLKLEAYPDISDPGVLVITP